MKQEFNPQDWINNDKNNPSTNRSFNPSPDLFSEVDKVIIRIEADLADITTSYADWLNLGFAFAHEFGEAGRTFYHRVSRFYNGYTKTETDKQYDQCLKSAKGSITINTFFHMAKQAGIDIATNEARKEVISGKYSGGSAANPSTDQSFTPSESDDDPPPEEEQPTLPDYLFDQLPGFFKRVVSRADSKEERDMLLLGSMVSIGSCLTTFSGIYDGNQVYPTLFLYIAAKASSGKGRLAMCHHLVNPVHWAKRKISQQENQEYEILLKEYNAQKGKDLGIEKPVKPPVRMHVLPGNITSAGLLKLLVDNDGQGVVIETEGDTLVKTLKSDLGDVSDFMRKDFHHEKISGFRKTDNEYSEVPKPRYNIILSSTLDQLIQLFPSTENGLYSRFLFYYMNLRPVWKNVFAHSNKKSLNQHFNELGQEFYSLYCSLNEKDPSEFSLTESQQDKFNAFFAQMQDKYLVLQGMDYMAIIRRLGLIAFRMMMILTAMRIPETGDFSKQQQCMDEDFESVLAIIKVMVRHASYIVSQLPAEAKTEKRGNKKEKFFEGLPLKFTNKEAVDIAKSFAITERSARRYISQFSEKGLLSMETLGNYINLSLKEGYGEHK